MFIVWGKKRVERSLGFVVDFCPICRAATAFQVSRVGMAGHVYYISFGEGELAGHTARCRECGTAKSVDATKYSTFEKQGDVDIERLIQITYPNFRNVYAERLDMENKLQSQQTFSPPDREAWLMEPFEYLSNKVEAKYSSTQFDKESGVGCLGTILLTALLWTASLTLWQTGLAHDRILIGMAIVAGAGLIYTLTQLGLAPSRSVRRDVMPQLAGALRPLNPSRQEVTQCLAKLKTAGFKIGKKVNDEKLWVAIQQHRGSIR